MAQQSCGIQLAEAYTPWAAVRSRERRVLANQDSSTDVAESTQLKQDAQNTKLQHS